MTNSEETEAETEKKEGRQVSRGDRDRDKEETENKEGRQVRERRQRTRRETGYKWRQRTSGHREQGG